VREIKGMFPPLFRVLRSEEGNDSEGELALLPGSGHHSTAAIQVYSVSQDATTLCRTQQ